MNITQGEWEAYLTDTKPEQWTICTGRKGEIGICKTLFDNLIPAAEKKANAHLIAAAPDMYEALNEIYPLLENIYHLIHHSDDDIASFGEMVYNWLEDGETVSSIVKTLNKAKGK